MNVLTIGGATQDIFLNHYGADSMTLSRNDGRQRFMLFEAGEKIEVSDISYITGGGATNTAVAFSQLGYSTAIICCVGQDEAGDAVLQTLSNHGITTKHITTSPSLETGRSFVINSALQERTIFTYRGANNHLDLQNIDSSALQTADLVYITSLSSEPARFLPLLCKSASEAGCLIAINPGINQLRQGAALLKETLGYTQMLIMNYNEAHTFMVALINSSPEHKSLFASAPKKPSCPTPDSTDAYLIDKPVTYNDLYFSMREFFKEIIAAGPQYVVITNGDNGVYVATRDEILFHPSVKVPVVDTVGAGDAFGACFSAAIASGQPVEEALRRGVVSSASVLQFMGAKEGLLAEQTLIEKTMLLPKHLLQRSALR